MQEHRTMTAQDMQRIVDSARAVQEHLTLMQKLAADEPAIREHVVLAVQHVQSAARYIDALPTCRSCGDVVSDPDDLQCSDCARFEQSRNAWMDELVAAGDGE
jgi:hypothetical protein